MSGTEEDKDAIIASLRAEAASLRESVSFLEGALLRQSDLNTTFYASKHSQATKSDIHDIPEHGMPAGFVQETIEQLHLCDFRPRLNTSSYVNVVFEKEEKEVALLGASVNLADASVYPASVKIHDHVVNLLAKLWNAPDPPIKGGNYCGAGTVGSTEACLLAGLALKFRWRKWYQERFGLEEEEVVGIKPNIVISTAYQAAWEKFFRYFDVTPVLVRPNLLQNKMAIDPKDLVSHCNEKTIAVVAILGNHYNGVYDPVWDVDAEVQKLNEENGWQIGIHVDAASGGFVAPFQSPSPPPFDFRLPNVMSMSTSGHKFGESICGTGWVVFRERKNLAEHIAVSVTYLGGHCDSITLNFSRPASGPYVQYYKLLRLGKAGYSSKVENQMQNTALIRDFLKSLTYQGQPRFEILDGGDTCCLPVVAARLNPEINLAYNDIDLQHALAATHWYVSGYNLGFENFQHGGNMEDLCSDVGSNATMFRIVCKSNITRALAQDLCEKFVEVLSALDSLKDGYMSLHSLAEDIEEAATERAILEGVSKEAAAATVLAAGKWVDKARASLIEKQAKRVPRRRRSISHAVC